MAMKPNYAFERRERDRLKAEKKAKRAAEKKAAAETAAAETAAGETTADGSQPATDQDGEKTD
ncbi:MAG: hypothetical protein RLO01_12030 [Thalassobaculaceae bacterium]